MESNKFEIRLPSKADLAFPCMPSSPASSSGVSSVLSSPSTSSGFSSAPPAASSDVCSALSSSSGFSSAPPASSGLSSPIASPDFSSAPPPLASSGQQRVPVKPTLAPRRIQRRAAIRDWEAKGDLYKTEICRNGANCVHLKQNCCLFAHSPAELRQKPAKWSKVTGQEHGRTVMSHPKHHSAMISVAIDGKEHPLYNDYTKRAEECERQAKFLEEQKTFLAQVFNEEH